MRRAFFCFGLVVAIVGLIAISPVSARPLRTWVDSRGGPWRIVDYESSYSEDPSVILTVGDPCDGDGVDAWHTTNGGDFFIVDLGVETSFSDISASSDRQTGDVIIDVYGSNSPTGPWDFINVIELFSSCSGGFVSNSGSYRYLEFVVSYVGGDGDFWLYNVSVDIIEPTSTPTSSPTDTPTNTPTPGPTSTPTNTPVPTNTPTPTPLPTSTPVGEYQIPLSDGQVGIVDNRMTTADVIQILLLAAIAGGDILWRARQQSRGLK